MVSVILLTQTALFQMGFRSSSASLIDLPSSILYVSGGVPFPRVISWSFLPSFCLFPATGLILCGLYVQTTENVIQVTVFLLLSFTLIDWILSLKPRNKEWPDVQVHPNRFDRSLKIVNCPFSFHPSIPGGIGG